MSKVDLKVAYAGLSLRNPIIVASSGLTDTVDKVKVLESCGAGAVVLKSLFEEQILAEVDASLLTGGDNSNPEAADFLREFATSRQLDDYVALVRACKEQCAIPIIASINCHSLREWTDFARRIEQAGADALEVNVMTMDTSKSFEHGQTELLHLQILAKLRKTVAMPIIMKLSRGFTNLVALATQIQHNDASAVVLFNWPYSPDIDVEKERFVPGEIVTSHAFFADVMRWTGIVSGLVPNLDVAASGGIAEGNDLIKLLLVGGKAGELCSAIYRHGPDVIEEILQRLAEWMLDHDYPTVESFRGKLNFANFRDESYYERLQFMKYDSEEH
jgi:dihydroorotate dehydrogenase (fumarate)